MVATGPGLHSWHDPVLEVVIIDDIIITVYLYLQYLFAVLFSTPPVTTYYVSINSYALQCASKHRCIANLSLRIGHTENLQELHANAMHYVYFLRGFGFDGQAFLDCISEIFLEHLPSEKIITQVFAASTVFSSAAGLFIFTLQGRVSATKHVSMTWWGLHLCLNLHWMGKVDESLQLYHSYVGVWWLEPDHTRSI